MLPVAFSENSIEELQFLLEPTKFNKKFPGSRCVTTMIRNIYLELGLHFDAECKARKSMMRRLQAIEVTCGSR